MNDKQKQMLVTVEFLEQLLDLVDQKKLSREKYMHILDNLLQQIEQTDLSYKIKERMENELQKEGIVIQLHS